MLFKRKAYDDLLAWKQGNGESAILIEGARRTGKSTLAERFAQAEYESYLLINFETAPQEVRDIFNDYRDNVDTFFKYLLAYYGVRLERRRSLIIFDEVQRFPIARSYIKHLVADGRFDYMETGSLISIKKNVEDILIPSEEDKIDLGPLDFEEFLWATGNTALADLIAESFESGRALPSPLHRKASQLWREYLLVGGMPQSVAAYLETDDFAQADRAKRRILNLYREDIMKFGGEDASRATAVFDAVPGQLAKHEKKFTLASARPGARYREYAGAFFWLEDARMVNLCLNVTDPNVGLDLSAERSNFKCYLGDTGLLSTLAFGDRKETLDSLYRNVLFGKISVNEGMLVENAVAQQLRANGHKLRFYSHRNDAKAADTMEIDFLIVREYANAGLKPRLSPLEVKSSNRFSTRSLDKFKAKFGKRVGTELVLIPKPFSIEGDRMQLPLYMGFCL
ncbi:ATP-binding protein [Arabiibacter massiliensis]|uniref:ATP-binding protein n=1 Tax=Arabiibacter massiliensis TaxID=1870985 RepID=UPI0009B9E215|nr:AAA family ATPase [Arabiibacter massiliensis]